MGVWNSHTSVGNITGSLIAGIWVNHAWGWSFAVPGMIIGAIGVLAFFFLVTGNIQTSSLLAQSDLRPNKKISVFWVTGLKILG